MAIISKEDGINIWRDLYRNKESKSVLKSTGRLPSTNDLKAVFQVFEDLWTGSDVANKAAIDGIVGGPMSPRQIQELGTAWLSWRAK